MASTPVDLFLTYQFLRRLATPFTEWDAYKLGIIDENGKVLRKAKTFTKPEEKLAWGYFDRLVANLKKLLAKVPGGQTKLASYAAALLLIKECKNPRDIDDDELEIIIEQLFTTEYNFIKEDEGGQPVNNVGDGKVAAIGIGSQGEPPKKMINKLFKRKLLDVANRISP